MPPPKYFESPNTVQTSLLGYDRHKKVQFQLNHLRGNPILVMRSDTINTKSENHQQHQVQQQAAQNRGGFAGAPRGGGPRSPKQWVDRSHRIPVPLSNKQMYPSYAHFHHQYSCPKPAPQPFPVPTSLMQCEPQDQFTHHTSHDRSRFNPPISPLPLVATCPVSPKLTPEDEIAVKRLFDKLAVPATPPASTANSSFSTTAATGDITLLELNPKMATKTFKTTNPEPEVNTSFMLDSPPISSSESRRTSISDSSSAAESITESPTTSKSPEPEVIEKPKGHSCPDETQCKIFREGKCVNEEEERRVALQWYNDLIQWRHDIVTKKCFGPPRCHPPPLTVSIIGASRAQRANPFHRVGDVHPFAMEAMDHARRKMDARRPHRLIPADLPLPPPHEFMANAKCMEPHLFVEYCYQLTAAAYVDTGLNPPNRRPPIPPRIEPIPDLTCRESVYSSASEFSSDGEYSDDSDGTKKERLRQKLERHSKRERRLQQIFHRRQMLDEIDEEEDN